MDSDIYAHAPAILLGTVDKLALIGQSARTIARVLGMFGFPAWHHVGSDRFVSPYTREQFRKGPQAFGCEPVFPFYDDGDKLFLDPYPLLEIQDEAHLLDESLGTFSGSVRNNVSARVTNPSAAPDGQRVASANGEYELAAAHRRGVGDGYRPGPTNRSDLPAFMSYFSHNLDRISTKAFTPGSKSGSGDPARDTSESAEHRTPTRRRYVSLLTNGRTHTAATVAVLSTFHLTISQSNESAYRRRRCGALASTKGNGGCAAGRYFSDRAIATRCSTPRWTIPISLSIINLNRIALLYVTNKKGGDNVKAALQDVVRRDHRLAGFDVPGVKTELITGAIDAGLIGAIVTEAASGPQVGTPFNVEQIRDSLRCVIATSAISHGVDVDEFNMMFFAGQPPDIAEYIQASSRIGRTHVGTSILIPTPQQRRDRYIVEIHDIFHQVFREDDRCGAGRTVGRECDHRTLASFLQLKLCGVDYIRNMNAAKIAGR